MINLSFCKYSCVAWPTCGLLTLNGLYSAEKGTIPKNSREGNCLNNLSTWLFPLTDELKVFMRRISSLKTNCVFRWASCNKSSKIKSTETFLSWGTYYVLTMFCLLLQKLWAEWDYVQLALNCWLLRDEAQLKGRGASLHNFLYKNLCKKWLVCVYFPINLCLNVTVVYLQLKASLWKKHIDQLLPGSVSTFQSKQSEEQASSKQPRLSRIP